MGRRGLTALSPFGLGVLLCAWLSSGCRDGWDDVTYTPSESPVTPEERPTRGPGDEGGATRDAGVGETPDGQVRAVHMALGQGAIDVRVAGRLGALARELSYGKRSSQLDLSPGTHRLIVTPLDAGDALDVELEVRAGARTTVILYSDGMQGTFSKTRKLSALVVDEEFGIANERARLRFVHLGGEDQTYDLDMGADNAGEPELFGLAPGGLTEAAGLDVQAAPAFRLGLAREGALLAPFTLPLPADAKSLVILAPTSADAPESTGLFVLENDNRARWYEIDPELYVVHVGQFGGKAELLDLYVGERPDETGYREYGGGVEVVSEMRYGTMHRLWMTPGETYIEALLAREGTTRPRGQLAEVQTSMFGVLQRAQRYVVLLWLSNFNRQIDSTALQVLRANQLIPFGTTPETPIFGRPETGMARVRFARQFDSRLGPRTSQQPEVRVDLRPVDMPRGMQGDANIVTTEEDASGAVPYLFRDLRFDLLTPEKELAAGSYVLDLRLAPAAGPACKKSQILSEQAHCVAQRLASFPLEIRAGQKLLLLPSGSFDAYELFALDLSQRPFKFIRAEDLGGSVH